MKKIILIFLMGLTFCSTPVRRFKLLKGKALVEKTNRGFKITSTIKTVGFNLEKLNDNYSAHLSYAVNLITPAGDTLFDVDNGMIDRDSTNRIDTILIKSSIELDSSYLTGNYVVMFSVQDNNGNKKASARIGLSVKP